MPSNTAAWQNAPGEPLTIGPATYTSPGANEVVIQNRALAINPIDWICQGSKFFDFLEYPMIAGTDVAGEIVEVGSAVQKFKVGDRALGQAIGSMTARNSRGGFQRYTVVPANIVAKIPEGLSFERAAALPLGVSTAACGLFQNEQGTVGGGMFAKMHLGLQKPALSPKATGKTLIVWGGATSVGCNAIQLAVAAGYEVFTTASPKNDDMVKKLGALRVFDYHSSTLHDDMVDALKGKTLAGALMTSGDAAALFGILNKYDGRKFVSMTLPVPDNKPESVGANTIWGSTLTDSALADDVYSYLEKALAEGKYAAMPEPEVVGTGLEALQGALETQKRGVSAKKIVVTV